MQDGWAGLWVYRACKLIATLKDLWSWYFYNYFHGRQNYRVCLLKAQNRQKAKIQSFLRIACAQLRFLIPILYQLPWLAFDWHLNQRINNWPYQFWPARAGQGRVGQGSFWPQLKRQVYSPAGCQFPCGLRVVPGRPWWSPLAVCKFITRGACLIGDPRRWN